MGKAPKSTTPSGTLSSTVEPSDFPRNQKTVKFSEKLRLARSDKSIFVAAKVWAGLENISPSSAWHRWKRYEAGVTTPRLSAVINIAKSLNIDVRDLLPDVDLDSVEKRHNKAEAFETSDLSSPQNSEKSDEKKIQRGRK